MKNLGFSKLVSFCVMQEHVSVDTPGKKILKNRYSTGIYAVLFPYPECFEASLYSSPRPRGFSTGPSTGLHRSSGAIEFIGSFS